MKYLLLIFLLNINIINATTVIGVFPEWSVYQANYSVSDIPAEKLTHIIYESIKLTDSGDLQMHDPYASLEKKDIRGKLKQKGNLMQLSELKLAHPHLSVLLSIGGWTNSSAFSDLLAEEVTRQHLVKEIAQLVKTYNADGVVIDWRYIGLKRKGNMVTRDADGDNLLLLLTALRQLNQPLQIAVTFPAWHQSIALLPAQAISEQVDFINLMSFDIHGYWENSTGHAAPLFSSAHPSVEFATSVDVGVQSLLSLGVDAQKIVVNVSPMGASWGGVNEKNGGLYQDSNAIPKGSFDNPNGANTGSLSGKDILSKLYQSDYQYHWDEETQSSYLFSQNIFDGHFISFESVRSLTEKMRYIDRYNLAGIAVQYLYADEFLVSDINRQLAQPELNLSSSFRHNPLLIIIFIAIIMLVTLYGLMKWLRFKDKKQCYQQQAKLLETQSRQLQDLCVELEGLTQEKRGVESVIEMFKQDKLFCESLFKNGHSGEKVESVVVTLKKRFDDLLNNSALLSELHKISSLRGKLSYIKAEQGYTGLYCGVNTDAHYIYSRLRQILFYYDYLLQVHRSYLVNSDKILYLYQDDKGKNFIKLEGDIDITVGGSYLNALKQYQQVTDTVC